VVGRPAEGRMGNEGRGVPEAAAGGRSPNQAPKPLPRLRAGLGSITEGLTDRYVRVILLS
jgi:hypothetical protein